MPCKVSLENFRGQSGAECWSGVQSYAEPLLDILDPERRFFSHRLYRDSCLRVPSQSRPGMAFLMKDLTSLGRPLERLLIVDNTPTVRWRPPQSEQACRG